MVSIRRGSPSPAVVRLWLLRLALRTTIVEDLEEDWPDPVVCSALGLKKDEATDIDKFRGKLALELEKAESQSAGDDPVSRNLRLLAERLNLTATERSVVALAAYLESERALSRLLGVLDDDEEALHEAIAIAIDAPAEEVSRSLHPNGTLRGADLLRRERATRLALGPLILSPKLGRLLRRPFTNADELLANFFSPCAATSRLEISDFPHLAKELDIAVRLLRSAVDRHTTGINLLLHGPPGTGKTEIARLVAKLADCTLYEVTASDDDGAAADGAGRLAGFALCQRSLRAFQRAMVLFDEIEDVLPRRSIDWGGLNRETGGGKAWLNRSLEENQVPSVWVANAVDHIDPAYLRRFALVIEVPEPPPRVRRRLVDEALSGFGLSDAYLQKLAERPRLTPALIQHAQRVVTLLERRPDESVEDLIDVALDGVFRALDDSAGSRDAFAARLDLGSYDISYVNSSVPLDEVVRGLQRSRRATMLLSGPAGTGKTAFVAHLRDALNVPVVIRRVSDLQSCWLGQTEKNLANAFLQAEREGAILFLDEADSFFQSRDRAVRSWEISQVNELLVSMEQFEGILICATNLIDSFDSASMRRFDLKIRLEPLTHEQRARLFEATLRTLAGTRSAGPELEPGWAEDANLRDGVRRLYGLTPGDFAAAARRLRILGIAPESARLLAELEVEQSHKRTGRSEVVGFRRSAV